MQRWRSVFCWRRGDKLGSWHIVIVTNIHTERKIQMYIMVCKKLLLLKNVTHGMMDADIQKECVNVAKERHPAVRSKQVQGSQ